MPEAKKLKSDETKMMEINTVTKSPHVVYYRMWVKEGNAWSVIAEGDTTDDKPDFHMKGPFAKKSKIACWLGIGGNENTTYKALVTFGQNGKILENGTCLETGRTDENGYAEVWINVIT